jgi:primosomal protein N' (replication factor Y)
LIKTDICCALVPDPFARGILRPVAVHIIIHNHDPASSGRLLKLIAVAIAARPRRLFEYTLDAEQAARIAPGMRVRVPFGRREEIAWVAAAPYEATAPGERNYKPVLEVLDAAPLLDARLIALCRWAADYYQHPLGEVFAAAVPSLLRRGLAPGPVVPSWFRLTESGHAAYDRLPARARVQRALLAALAAGPLPREKLLAHATAAAQALRRALDAGWIEACAPPAGAGAPMPVLTAEQAALVERLQQAEGGFRAVLLEGVTGSGKTEIYLRLAARCLARGEHVLVLTPEIGLTPQLAARLAERFGTRVVSYHSGMGEAERARVWLAAAAGQVDIVVGTRSAVFVPLPRLGLIVVDEEHDVSYKQQEGLRYSGRDLALVRARLHRIPALLGSATPSLESLYNAAGGRYLHVRLSQRVHATAAPRIGVVDLRGRVLHEGVAEPLLEACARHLAAGGQALLFLNRRGFAPALLCHACGWAASCPDCDARLVLHRARQRLICHHCGRSAPQPVACPECGGKELLAVGQGTERIEELLRLRFPEYRVERFDSDRLARAGELARLLADVRENRIRILVGTQVLAKGHDFANLSFAGLLGVDQALYSSDFRALERMGQLVTQVAGRVGRAGQPGEVLLQTHQREHPLLRLLVEQGYPAFSAALLAERRQFGLPPYAHLALLRAEARSEGTALAFLHAARAALPADEEVQALGPAPAGMARRAGYHRAQLLLRSRARLRLQRLLAAWMPALEQLPGTHRVRWSLDVDPADLF